MCTGGRIRLFWGVFPNVMILALTTSLPRTHFLLAPFAVFPQKRQEESVWTMPVLLLIISIYIYRATQDNTFT